jgi:hypothetical protein
MTDTRDDGSKQQARSELVSIRELVAALECDYDRLAELRQDREGWEAEHGDPRDWPAAEELAELEAAAGDCESADQARERIEQDPLSVQVRSDWHTPDEDPTDAGGQFEILLCTGGPACRIVGELDESFEPRTARLQHQDWGTPWADWPLDCEDEEVLLAYARCFYFGS